MAASTMSSGTLIGAVMESVGYHYQSAILDALANPFQSDVGGFIYLIGVCVVVFHVAIKGKYELGAWLLIGPPLFFAAVLPRTATGNANWMYGKQPRTQADVNREVQRLLRVQGQAGGGAPRVATVFEKYNRMVSATSQEMVRIINDNKNDTDWWFVMKAELFSRLHTGVARDVDFERLIHRALLLECGQLIDLARQALDPLNPNVQPRPGATPAPANAFSPNARDALTRFNAEFRRPIQGIDTQTARYLAVLELGGTPGQAPQGIHADENAIRQRQAQIVARGISCQTIWNAVYEGLVRRANWQLNALRRHATNNHIGESRLINLMARAHGLGGARIADSGGRASAQQIDNLVRVIAMYMLRNEMQRPSFGAWISSLENRYDFREASAHVVGNDAMTEQARLASREWGEKARLMSAAGNLPYYQGLALYFLGVTYPFFALMLLVPGKHAGFLMWFVLWLWVKSWDVASAMVMLLDDILFSMLAAGRDRGGVIRRLSPDIGATLRAMEELDPSFSMSTYYSIIAVAILSIPVVTAQLILGSLQGGAGLIAQGLEKFSSNFADGEIARIQQNAINNLRFMSRELVGERAKAYFQNDLAGRGRYQGFANPVDGDQINWGTRAGLHRGRNLYDQERVAGWQRFGGGLGQHLHQPNTIATGMLGMAGQAGGLGKRLGLNTPDGRAIAKNLKAGQKGWSAKKDYALRAMRGIAGAGGEILDTYGRNNMAMRQRDIAAGQEWAVWDSDSTMQTKQLMQMSRVYGVLEVPWFASSGEPFKAELEHRLQRMNNQYEEYRSYFAAARIAAEQLIPERGQHRINWQREMGGVGFERQNVGAGMIALFMLGNPQAVEAMRGAHGAVAGQQAQDPPGLRNNPQADRMFQAMREVIGGGPQALAP